MAKKTILFIVLYFLYVPAVFFLLASFSDYLGFIPDVLRIPLLILVIGGPALIFSITFTMPSSGQKWLQKNGVLAPAQILNVRDTGVTFNGGLSFSLMLTLRVMPQGDQPFEIQLEGIFSRINFPSNGGMVEVKYNPADKNSVVLANS